MSWIKIIKPDQAEGLLAELYARLRGPGGETDNIMLAHSLRPHTLAGHMTLYKNVLHHRDNRLPRWLAEAIGVYVSLLNGCDYCVRHHSAGLARLLADPDRFNAMIRALATDQPGDAFSEPECAALGYARRLTREPARMQAEHIEELRAAGWSDGEILEINQIAAYFAYANRTVLGLGVTTEGDVLGLSPGASGGPDDWRHA